MSMQQVREQQRKKQLAAEKEMEKSYNQAEKKAKQVCAGELSGWCDCNPRDCLLEESRMPRYIFSKHWTAPRVVAAMLKNLGRRGEEEGRQVCPREELGGAKRQEG